MGRGVIRDERFKTISMPKTPSLTMPFRVTLFRLPRSDRMSMVSLGVSALQVITASLTTSGVTFSCFVSCDVFSIKSLVLINRSLFLVTSDRTIKSTGVALSG